jgi:acyl carrier protein
LLTGSFEVIADRMYEDHELLQAGFEDGSATNLEQFLLAWVALRLNEGLPADPEKSLPAYGIDSLMAVELTEETKTIFGFEWPPYLFFDEISIAQLAKEGLTLMENR